MTRPHDRPTPAELIEAVEEMLERRIAATPDDPNRFENRVAAHALGIARRELESSSEHAERHRTRLDRLGVADDVELADAIRSGRLDDRWADVMGSVREAVLDKLAVSRPGYDIEPTTDDD